MNVKVLERRVDKLEDMMMRLAYVQQKTEMELQRLSEEMREFKEEMKEFKEEMREFKDWAKRSIENLNRELGRIANKMGRLVEDIVSPALQEVVERYFGCEIEQFAERVKKRINGKIREIDVLIVCGDIIVVNETKSTVRHSYVEEFVEFINSGEFFEHFPEYKGKKLVGIFSSLNIPYEEVNYLTKHGIYAMQMKGAYMDIVNFDEVGRSHP